MNRKIPHIVQYQGSKRNLASQILQYMPHRFNRCLEPFAGSGAISIAASMKKDVSHFIINDLNAPLINMIKKAIENPHELYDEYSLIWNEQFTHDAGHVNHFYKIRDEFNNVEQAPAYMLYLLSRCVKGSVRYNSNGDFNQSPDKRRHGTNPKTVLNNIILISKYMKGKTSFFNTDYRDILKMAKSGDIIYMDPPYQGTSAARDSRYVAGLNYDEFILSLYELNKKNIDFIISYDGFCGNKSYGRELPMELGCSKILLNAGRSTQATLLGRADITIESLYISKNLTKCGNNIPQQQLLWTEVS